MEETPSTVTSSTYSEQIQLSPETIITVKYEITSGDILISTILAVFVFLFLLRWGYEVILRGRS